MTRHFSRFQGLSRAESGRKGPVPANVGNRGLDAEVNTGKAGTLLAAYHRDSPVGPTGTRLTPSAWSARARPVHAGDAAALGGSGGDVIHGRSGLGP